jgi:hypothetical protein
LENEIGDARIDIEENPEGCILVMRRLNNKAARQNGKKDKLNSTKLSPLYYQED